MPPPVDFASIADRRSPLPAGRCQDTHRQTPTSRSILAGGLNLPRRWFHLGRRAPWLVALRSMVEYCDGGEGRQAAVSHNGDAGKSLTSPLPQGNLT